VSELLEGVLLQRDLSVTATFDVLTSVLNINI